MMSNDYTSIDSQIPPIRARRSDMFKKNMPVQPSPQNVMKQAPASIKYTLKLEY